MDYKTIRVENLELNPKNIRPLDNIDELAESIARYGLLQNLVVVLNPRTGKYMVKAGNRRLKAIQKLVSEGRWGEPIKCLVQDDEPWTELVENVCRQQVPIWRLGARYSELAEAGYTAPNIASRLGKSHGQISYAINIARGIHPDIIAILEKMAPETFTLHQLVRVSRIQNPQTFKPDFDAQKRELSRMLDSKPRGRRPDILPERIAVWNRYKKLKAGRVNYPAAAEPYIDALIEYLSGATDRLTFNR
jgi:ParB/RepB/Spo0J family partition protein